MMQMLTRRAEEYRQTLKIMMEFYRHDWGLGDLPDAFLPNLYAAFSNPAPARNPRELCSALEYLERRAFFGDGFSHLLKYAATITTVLALAAKLKYRQVVLCGIDLRSQAYFFQYPNLFPETPEVSLVRARNRTKPTSL